MPHRIVTLLLALSLVLSSAGSTHAKPAAAPAAAPEPAFSSVMFIENVGQFAEGARFQVWGGPAGTMWLADDAIWFTVVEPRSEEAAPSSGDPKMRIDLPLADAEGKGAPRNAINIKLSFVGANPHPHVEPFDRLDTVVSYFTGNDPAMWRPNVPVWSGVRYVNLYPDVDLEITSENGQLVQRLTASSGADLGAVRLRAEGADALQVDGDALRLSTAAGEVTLPLLTSERASAKQATVECPDTRTCDVAAPFALSPNQQSAIPNPQSAADDPADLFYSTFLGGAGSDHGEGIAVDGTGSAFVTGDAGSPDFPTTPGSFDVTYNRGDAFVAKLNPTGSGLAYATFLGGGGDGWDWGTGIAVDQTGNAYVTGYAGSSDFPTTPDAFDRTYGGGLCGVSDYPCPDAFAVKLNPAGNALIYATFLGGNGYDIGEGIAVDNAGNAYVTGGANRGFPTTPGAFDGVFGGGDSFGGNDAFVAKLNPTGSGLSYATFLGGSRSDGGWAIAVDGEGNAYVTGGTSSSDFPTTPGAFDPSNETGGDGFVVKMSSSGSALAYSTFLGGGTGLAIAVDQTGDAYVTGVTGSGTFPTTAGAYDRSFNGDSDAFLSKLNLAGTALTYATYLGGSRSDVGWAIAVDGTGSAYITGATDSSDFPTTPGAFDPSFNSFDGYYTYTDDAFVTTLNPDGGALIYSTYVGGSADDAGYGIAVGGVSRVYMTGQSYSSGFPTTPPSFDTSYADYGDGFVMKIGSSPVVANDDFNEALVLSVIDNGLDNQYHMLDTTGATVAADDPDMGCGDGRNANTLWFTLTPAFSGAIRFRTYSQLDPNASSNYDTVLAAFTGTRGALTRMACNDDVGDRAQSEMILPVSAGQVYYVEVAQKGTPPGGGRLSLFYGRVPMAIGYVRTQAGVGVAGVTIPGSSGTPAITDAQGRYVAWDVPKATAALQPSALGYVFYPEYSAPITAPATSSIDFVAYPCSSGPSGLDLCKLQVGDIFLESGAAVGEGSSQDALIIRIGGSYFTHAALYIGVLPEPGVPNSLAPRLVEAQGTMSNPADDVWETSLLTSRPWTGEQLVDWAVVRPTASLTQRAAAIQYARQKAADDSVRFQICERPNSCDPLRPADLSNEAHFYCSKLVWTAYQKAGVETRKQQGLANIMTGGWVKPEDLFYGSPEVQSRTTTNATRLKRLFWRIYSPAHLMLTDPAGHRTGFDPATGNVISEIPGAFYTGIDSQIEAIHLTEIQDTTGWRIQVQGYAAGEYTLESAYLLLGTKNYSDKGTTEPAQVDTYSVKPPRFVVYMPLLVRFVPGQ